MLHDTVEPERLLVRVAEDRQTQRALDPVGLLVACIVTRPRRVGEHHQAIAPKDVEALPQRVLRKGLAPGMSAHEEAKEYGRGVVVRRG